MTVSTQVPERRCSGGSCDFRQLIDTFGRSFEQRLAERGMLLSTRYTEPVPRCFTADREVLGRLLDHLADCSMAVEARGCAVLDIAAEAAGEGSHNIYIILTLSGKGLAEARDGREDARGGGGRDFFATSLERARAICRGHGGNIHVENSNGFGTRFMLKICLPAA